MPEDIANWIVQIHNSLYVNTLKAWKKEVGTSAVAACPFEFRKHPADDTFAWIFYGLAGDGCFAWFRA